MRPSLILRAAHARTPMIKFLGKRSYPSECAGIVNTFNLADIPIENVDHSPQPHPASPTHQLPESFASYRQKAQQHGPLGGQKNSSSGRSFGASMGGPTTYGAIGGKAGRDLGPIQPKEGEYFDISELPKRFQRRPWTEEELDATTSGGASMW